MMTVDERLGRIARMLEQLLARQPAKEWYTVGELAALAGRAPFTVRAWCRTGRVNARRSGTGAGPVGRWVIPHEEWLRVQAEGLLPPRGAKC